MYCFHARLHEVFRSAQYKNHDEYKYYCDCTDSEFLFVYKYLYNALYTRRNSSKLVLLENTLKKAGENCNAGAMRTNQRCAGVSSWMRELAIMQK